MSGENANPTPTIRSYPASARFVTFSPRLDPVAFASRFLVFSAHTRPSWIAFWRPLYAASLKDLSPRPPTSSARPTLMSELHWAAAELPPEAADVVLLFEHASATIARTTSDGANPRRILRMDSPSIFPWTDDASQRRPRFGVPDSPARTRAASNAVPWDTYALRATEGWTPWRRTRRSRTTCGDGSPTRPSTPASGSPSSTPRTARFGWAGRLAPSTGTSRGSSTAGSSRRSWTSRWDSRSGAWSDLPGATSRSI